MKRLVNYIGTLFALFCIYSCVEEPIIERNGSRSLRFSIITAEEGIVQTRAANSNGVNNVFVLIFKAGSSSDAEPVLEDWAQASGAGTSTYTATLKEGTQGGPMYVLANAPIAENLRSGGALVLEKGMTLSTIKEKLIVPLRMNIGLIVQQPEHAPMVSEEEVYDPESGTNATVQLTRATAKVVVNNLSGNAAYALMGANMGNAPIKGSLFASQSAQTETAHYGAEVSGKASLENMMSEVTITAPTKTEPLYLFEVAKAKEPFVIIKGTYNGLVGYHRLNIWDRTKEEYLDIVRNNQYILTISKLTTSGYRTADEAINNPASNRDIDYNIEVTDPSSHDIVTNGEQYLGLSNSELVIYRTGALSGVLATNATYTCCTDWKEGTVTATGVGLSIHEGNTLPNNGTTVTKQDVKVSCTEAFTSGTLTLRVGDLCKVVKVTRHPTLSATPKEIVFDHATLGDKSQSGAMSSNIHFTDKSGIYSDDKEIFVSSGNNKLHTLIAANVGYNNSASVRNGEFFVASTQDEGRTKVMFKQEMLDVYDAGKMQIQPYTYVATFHRAYQTAERIIRIKMIESDPESQWTAVVLVGQHFIELDAADSNDTGIHSAWPYGYNEKDAASKDIPIYTTDEEIEQSCQFTTEQKGKTLVTGKGDKIYFRVGMKSKLAEKDKALTTQPRYGLIAFLYEEKSHLIYVRQGECEDYIMRPVDPITNHTGLTRTAANKILPYNLTVPGDKETEVFVNVGSGGGAPTEYPSQGGYFFQGKKTGAYFPFKKDGVDVNWGSASFVSEGDPCPVGFRRPTDGATANGGSVAGSELRQSFWLNPLNGQANSSFDNFIRGYIADGYYDRRPMRVAVEGSPDDGTSVYTGMKVDGTFYSVPTLVGQDAKAGYAGHLIYNPTTYASVFLPANGFRFSQMSPAGALRGVGDITYLWTSTMYSNWAQQWYLAIGALGSSYELVFDNYPSVSTMGSSIRCVKK